MKKIRPKKDKKRYFQARLTLLLEEGPRSTEWAEKLRNNEIRTVVRQLKRHGVYIDPAQLERSGVHLDSE